MKLKKFNVYTYFDNGLDRVDVVEAQDSYNAKLCVLVGLEKRRNQVIRQVAEKA